MDSKMENKIRNDIEKLFNNKLINLYNENVDKTELWNKNVKKFIETENNKLEDKLEEIDNIKENMVEDELELVQQIGFDIFVGDECADIDEDEFDGPNDLAMEEWEELDDIILYYYKTM